MSFPKKRLNSKETATCAETSLLIDGVPAEAYAGEVLLDVLNRMQRRIPQVCYHQQMGTIGSCDTCMIELDGVLIRACETPVPASGQVSTNTQKVDIAQREAFDRLLENHDLYCTVCDNNNQNCTVHNAVGDMKIEHQARPFTPKPYAQDHSNAFIATILRNAFSAGGVSKCARMFKSTRPLPLTGRENIRA